MSDRSFTKYSFPCSRVSLFLSQNNQFEKKLYHHCIYYIFYYNKQKNLFSISYIKWPFHINWSIIYSAVKTKQSSMSLLILKQTGFCCLDKKWNKLYTQEKLRDCEWKDFSFTWLDHFVNSSVLSLHNIIHV